MLKHTSWSVLLLRWDTDEAQKQDAEHQETLKKKRTLYVTSSWLGNAQTPAQFVIYSFLTFGSSFEDEKETLVTNRKSLHTTQNDATSCWANPLLIPDIQKLALQKQVISTTFETIFLPSQC